MTLTTHAIVGGGAMTASVAALGVTPAGLTLGVAAGFASHFAIDAIPHWAEARALLRSSVYDDGTPLKLDMLTGAGALRDFAVVSADGLLGLLLSMFIFSFWLFQLPLWVVFLGAAASDLPDALQLVYFKTRLQLMEPLQHFHMRIQTELPSLFSIGIEVALVVLVVGALKLFV